MAKGQIKSNTLRINERRAIKDWPESERPREKLFQLGPEGLSDGESLAVLLRTGATGQSTEVSINQDMCALIPKRDVPAIGDFIAAFLTVSQKGRSVPHGDEANSDNEF